MAARSSRAPDLDLADLADQSGCTLVEAGSAVERLAAAARGGRQARLIVIEAGWHPGAGVVDEIASLMRHEPPGTIAALRAAPATPLQRLLPRRAPVVGVLCPTAAARGAAGFPALARLARRGLALQTSARPIA